MILIMSTKLYRCPLCGFTIRTGPYAWLIELEDELKEKGKITCPRCKRAEMNPV